MNRENGACPICGLVTGEDTCQRCGWLLSGPVVIGAIESNERAAFDTAFSTAAAQWDVIAAIRAAGPTGRTAQRIKQFIHAYARSQPGAPYQTLLDQVIHEEQAQLPADHSLIGELGSLTLHRKPGDSLVVIELNRNGVSYDTLVVQAAGLVQRQGNVARLSWGGLLPDPATGDDEEDRFLAAGGHGHRQRPPEWWIEVNRELDAVVQLVAPSSQKAVLVVNRVPGWRMPQVIASQLQGLGAMIVNDPKIDERADLRKQIDQALGRVTLPETYYLALANVDDFGNVSMRRHELQFSRTSADALPEASIALASPPSPADTLLLPIVSGDSLKPENWTLRALWSMPQAPRQHDAAICTVRFAYQGGQPPVFTTQPQFTPESQKWKAICRKIPPKVDRDAARAIDLLVAIELSGPNDAVEPRKQLLVEVLDALQQSSDRIESLKVGVIGYQDHQYPEDIDDEPVTLRLPFADLKHNLAGFKRRKLQNDLRQDLYGAPIEDMLHIAGSDPFRWRTNARRILLTFWSRPPHPPNQQADSAVCCRRHFNWEDELKALKMNECYSVECEPPWDNTVEARRDLPESFRNRLKATSGALGADGVWSYEDESIDASHIVEALLGAEATQDRIPLTSLALHL